ncbi:MAG: filament integrity protein FraC, partial [Elainellaceae cyanobacterium]
MVWVLPLRAVVLQSLFLLIAIATEAAILHWELKLSYKRSIEYATSLNLLSVVMGWLVFFLVLPILDEGLEQALVGYVLFDRLPDMLLLIGVSGFITFMLSFFVKLQGLNLLERLLERVEATPTTNEPPPPQARRPFTSAATSYKGSDRSQFLQQPDKRDAVLLANAASYTAISIV